MADLTAAQQCGIPCCPAGQRILQGLQQKSVWCVYFDGQIHDINLHSSLLTMELECSCWSKLLPVHAVEQPLSMA